MNSHLQNVLKICERYLFLKPVFNDLDGSVLQNFKFGPLGELLCRNIKNEWFYSNVTSRDELVLPFSYSNSNSDDNSTVQELKEHCEQARFISGNKIPFSIVYIRDFSTQNNKLNNVNDETCYFRPQQHTQLKYIALATPSDGQQFFYYWQRQRKMWWRKFSANPGRFSLTDIQTNNNKMEFTEIRAEFEWSTESIEMIKNVGDRWFEPLSKEDRKMFEFKLHKKTVLPHIIEATVTVEGSAMTFLCDAFHQEKYINAKNNSREVMKLHRRLTPYKTTFSITPTNNEKINEDLKLLVSYLMQQLHKAGISTLSSFPEQKSLEDEYLLHDIMGIPFTIILCETTLSDGIVGVRSRETTLQEKLHISQLENYLDKLMKSY